MKKQIIALILCSFFIGGTALCEEDPRLVTVTGEGEVMTVPNEVWVNLQVESFDPNLSKAKKANDDAIQQVLVIVKKHNVDDKDFKTDYFNVRNEERYFMDPVTNQQRSKRGFFVTKNIAIVLRDVTKFEALYSDALEAGVNNIYGVEFKTSELKTLRDQARTMAVQAAKEKAEKLASALGQEISRPHAIQENVETNYWGAPRMMMSKMAMAESAPNNETIALGQIKVSASVTVSFELK